MVELEQARSILGWEELEEEEAIQVHSLNAASQTARRILGRDLAAAEYSKTIHGSGLHMVLPQYPIIEIVQLMEGEREVASGDYSMNSNAGILTHIRRWRGMYAVTWVAGYDPIPADVVHAVCEIAVMFFKRLRGLSGVKSNAADGVVTTSYEVDVPIAARRILERYQ